jgi:hypothetical protein
MVGVKSVPDAEYRIQTFRRYFVRVEYAHGDLDIFVVVAMSFSNSIEVSPGYVVSRPMNRVAILEQQRTLTG